MAANKVTTATFEEEVIKASHSEPVLVDFWAAWCGPCKMLTPIINEVAAEAKGFKVFSANADDEQDLLMKYGIQAIPTLIVFKDGEVYKRSTGLISKAQVLDLVK